MEANLKQRLNDELRQALRDRNKPKVSALRLFLNTIHNTEIARQAELSEGDMLAICAKEIKQRQESIEAFKKGNRQDLVDQEEAEMAVLNEYMPRQLSRDEIVAEARNVIQEVGAQSPRDKGKVMPVLVARLKGKADGREINAVVTELLGS
jgi:uncharacterized protein YqeY